MDRIISYSKDDIAKINAGYSIVEKNGKRKFVMLSREAKPLEATKHPVFVEKVRVTEILNEGGLEAYPLKWLSKDAKKPLILTDFDSVGFYAFKKAKKKNPGAVFMGISSKQLNAVRGLSKVRIRICPAEKALMTKMKKDPFFKSAFWKGEVKALETAGTKVELEGLGGALHKNGKTLRNWVKAHANR